MSFKYKELGECIDLIIDNRGKTPKKMGSDWVEKGIKTISAKNVHNGKLDNCESIRFVNSEVYKKWMKDDIKKGDCLLVSEGATLGENLYWDLDEKVVIGQRLYCIRTNEEILNSKYFSAYLNTVEYQKEIEGRSTGTSVLGIRQTELLKTKVLIMDIEEQKFIGNLYYDINLKIEVNNKINKNLEEIAQAIFKQWFVDFEFPNEEGKPYKSSGGEMIESELGMIPKGWNVGTLNDVLKILEAGNRPKGGAGNLNEGIPSIGAENIIGLGKYDFSKEKYITKEYFEKMKKGKVESGDVLLYKDGAQLGRKTLFKDNFPHSECAINSHVFRLRTNDLISQVYLYFWLDQSIVTQNIINLNANSAQPGINQTQVKSLKILIPCIEINNKFTEIVEKLLVKLFANLNENKRLENLRDTLLPNLMSGEIRVPLENNEN